MSKPDQKPPFHQLELNEILNATESAWYCCDGRVSALDSYENRVYQIGIEDDKLLVAKFYRPARWSDECILEEHSFTAELTEHEIPVLSPFMGDTGSSLIHTGSFHIALYPRTGGRASELDDPDLPVNFRTLPEEDTRCGSRKTF